MSTTDELVKRTARVLMGFMSSEEANAFASTGSVLNPAAFVAQWKALTAASTLSPGYAAPLIAPIPATMNGHVATLRANPLFAREYAPSADIKMIDVGKLIVCQWSVDTALSCGIPSPGTLALQPSIQELFERCLPTVVVPPLHAFKVDEPLGTTIYSYNNTFGIDGPRFGPDGQVIFAMKARAGLMLVREHAGRYVLINGHHRAWLYRSQKVTMVPAVILPTSTPEGVIPASGGVPLKVVFGARPPLVEDFFNDTLSSNVEVRALMKAVRLRAEMLSVPRLLAP